MRLSASGRQQVLKPTDRTSASAADLPLTFKGGIRLPVGCEVWIGGPQSTQGGPTSPAMAGVHQSLLALCARPKSICQPRRALAVYCRDTGVPRTGANDRPPSPTPILAALNGVLSWCRTWSIGGLSSRRRLL